jgi:hypothetical protein
MDILISGTKGVSFSPVALIDFCVHLADLID